MVLEIVNLEATKKTEHGSAVSGRLRVEGRVPGIVYGEGIDTLHVHVSGREIEKILNGPKGKNTPIDLIVDGETILTLPRDVQDHPIKPGLIHVDFIKVDKDKKVEADVPIHLNGLAEGVKSGGRLDQYEFSILLEAPSINIPVEITHDVSAMDIDDKLMLSDLILPADARSIREDEDVVVAQLLVSNLEAELEEMEADLAADIAAEASGETPAVGEVGEAGEDRKSVV